MLFLTLGFVLFLNGFYFYAIGIPFDDNFINFLCGLADISPMVLLAILTPKRVFTLLARMYEKNIGVLARDGSFMSALVQLADNRDKSTDYVWIQRDFKDGIEALNSFPAAAEHAYKNHVKYEYDDAVNTAEDRINRGFWMLGKLSQEGNGAKQRVTVRFQEDADLTWMSCYDQAKLFIHKDIAPFPWAAGATAQEQNADDPPERATALAFWAWKTKHFGNNNNPKYPNMFVDSEKELSVSWDYTGNNDHLDRHPEKFQERQDHLQDFALRNLREYQWPGDEFDESLLRVSPRELKDDLIKEQIYNKSIPVDLHSTNHRIDFFISHSWSDPADKKIEVLKRFSNHFKSRHGRYPTFWLDKVCINQKDPNDGIAVTSCEYWGLQQCTSVAGQHLHEAPVVHLGAIYFVHLL